MRSLVDVISAESLVAGFTTVPEWDDRNVDMSEVFKNGAMEDVLPDSKWVHSFFIQAPYPVVHQLYKDLVRQIKENH